MPLAQRGPLTPFRFNAIHSLIRCLTATQYLPNLFARQAQANDVYALSVALSLGNQAQRRCVPCLKQNVTKMLQLH